MAVNEFLFDGMEKSRKPAEETLGGKGLHLCELTALGIPVPRFCVMTTGFFESGGNAAAAQTMLDHFWSEAGTPADVFFAVRSSAVGEDGGTLSYAGQLDTMLFVRREDLGKAVFAVHDSVYGERARAYRDEHGLSGERVASAVVVQRMIDAESSGVAFGVDMERGSRRAETVSSVFGLGEGLVSGELEADTFYVRPEGIRRVIAEKSRACVMGRNGGTEWIALPPEKKTLPSLSDAQIREIADMVRRVSTAFGRAQDMEFAYDRDGVPHILQTRPVTTLGRLADPDGPETLWDNSNIVESYPGMTRPLTFSFIRGVYGEVYRQFCAILGVEKETVDANADAFEMLGIFRGRVYYNLLNWYRVLMLLPGYEINAPFMEQMMGVKEPLTERPEIVPPRRNKYLRVAVLCFGLLRNFLSLEKQIRVFRANFEDAVSGIEGQDLSSASPKALASAYRTLERRLLPAWQPPLVNDFFAMIYYGLLKKLLLKWNIDPHGTLQNDLLAGEGGMISAEPVQRLRHLAAGILDAPGPAALLRAGDRAEFLKKLETFPELHKEYREYLARFGKRCIGELKLETVTYEEDPSLLLDILRCYVLGGKTDPEEQRKREALLRSSAERHVEKSLAGKPLRRFLFRHVLNNARRLVKNRENLRFERTRLFAAVRKIFRELGLRFASEGILNHPRDIFDLTKSEIFDYIEGTAPAFHPAETAASRRALYEEYAARKIPAERFRTRGLPYWGNDFSAPRESSAEPSNEDGVLRGIGCCGGTARGTVRIVHDPRDTAGLTGCILAAERTDPGWAPLFPVCKAVLVERGSILSHAAIVTRELGIPSIVGVRNLTEILRDGEEIEMDGTAGTIRRLSGGKGDAGNGK